MPASPFRFTKRHSLLLVLLVATIATSTSIYLFCNKGMMSISWTFPYFSGAANFHRLFNWQISPADYLVANQILPQNYPEYRHQETPCTIGYSLNSYGYVLVALLSRTVFYWLGDLQSVIYFQILIHLTICFFFIVFIFPSVKERLIFIFLYAANPLVIYFATFPFYYFWLCVPSACFAVLLLKPQWRSQTVMASTLLLLISLLIRPTTLFLCLLFYVFAFKLLIKNRFLVLVPSLALFIAGALLFSSVNPRYPPWHTMYIGIGAYANNAGVSSLSDEEGYQYFSKKTGIEISTNPVSGNWGKPDLMKNYNEILKDKYIQILTTSPGTVAKNAILNLGQVFSIGYIDRRPLLSLLSSLIGYGVIAYLLICRQISWLAAIAASAASFFWYFPPIPAYNFASYLLLVCGFISSLSSRDSA